MTGASAAESAAGRAPLVFDGIIFSLQRTGGISVLFSEIIARLPAESYRLVGFREAPPDALGASRYESRAPRMMERYRRADIGAAALFHSTYYRLPRVPGPRIVTTVYDFVYERFASFPRRMVHSTQKRRAIAGSHRLICISESTRRDLLEFEGSQYEDRCVVVPLAASEGFTPAPHIIPCPQVLFVGARGGYKNFQSVVHAMGPLRELTLVCVGGGAFTAVERDLLERTIPGRYASRGYLSTAELNAEYNRSLCLAYPSLYEGFGIPVLEAMRAGCPVIAVAASSIPEVAGDAAVLLETGDPDAIRAAIKGLMQTEDRAALVRRGHARAAGFSWERTYQRTLQVYGTLLGHPMA